MTKNTNRITKILLSFGKIPRGSISMPFDDVAEDYRPCASVKLTIEEVDRILDLIGRAQSFDPSHVAMMQRFETIRGNMQKCIDSWQGP